MASLMQYLIVLGVILVFMFFSASLFTDANAASGQNYTDQYATFQRLNSYGNYFENQTDALRSRVLASQSTNINNNAPSTALNLIFYGVGIAAAGLIGFFDIGFAILSDAITYLGIPGFIAAIAVTILMLRGIFLIINSMRGQG